ncbi:MAG: 6-hydroxymethylpterin diphosphokinase MptE-like protein [bacterium]
MDPGPFFEKNLATLKSVNPRQGEIIAGFAPKVEHRLYPVTPLGVGFFNVSVPRPPEPPAALFLTPEPRNELDQWLAEPLREAEWTHAVILLGFGMGYEAGRILAALPPRGILAMVEPDPLQFFTAFHHTDLTVLLGDPRAHLYVGQAADQAVESIGRDLEWSRFLNLPYRVWAIPLLERVHPGFARQFHEAWQAARQRAAQSRLDRIEYGKRIVVHTIANAGAVIRYPGASVLFHHFSGIPAVLIAPGSSLDKNFNLLRQLQNRLLIACVDAAYPFLRAHGVRPHLVFSLETPERVLLALQDDVPSAITYLAADPRAHPDMLRHFHPRVFLAAWHATREPLGRPAPLNRISEHVEPGNAVYQWLQSLSGPKGDVYGPGGAAAMGFHILARMGCQPIILAGHDLPLPGEPAMGEGDASRPLEYPDVPVDSILEEAAATSNGAPGLYRQCLEHEIARFQVPVYNTSAGLIILGTITSRLESIFAELPNRVFDLPRQIAALHAPFKPRMDTIDLGREFARAVQRLEALVKTARAGLDLLPPDLEFNPAAGRGKDLLERLEQAVSLCHAGHTETLGWLEELLQLSRFEIEDNRWRAYWQSNEEARLSDQLYHQARLLDAYIGQARLLISLMEEQLERWENQ